MVEFRFNTENYDVGTTPEMDTLQSMCAIINRESHQRELEHADDFLDGHDIGIKCDVCQGTKFHVFGFNREKRTDNAPGYISIMYLHCQDCHEMIFLTVLSTLFVPTITSHGKAYRPDWGAVDNPQHSQITKASLHHMKCLEETAAKNAVTLIDWM